jgi:hypothetical protein
MMYLYLLLACCIISTGEAKWYSQICQAGGIESVSRDENGTIAFVQYPIGADEDENVDDDGNLFSHNDTNRHRNLRHSGTPAIRVKLEEGGKRYLPEDNSNDTSTDKLTIFHVRPCLCHPSQHTERYHSDEEIFLCPADADYCGIPFADEPIGCYSVSVQEVVARNAWPLILFWYFGMFVICCCTIHGHTATEYLRSCFQPERNAELMDRMLAANPTPPPYRWSWWTWQRFQFEHNLLAQAQWIWRHQEYLRQRYRRAQGLPPPQLLMKTKRYVREEEEEELQHEEHDDNDSLHEPTCTICFVPLENGDRIGALECDHNFHVDCLKTWLKRRNACPLCAAPAAERRQLPDDVTTDRRSPAAQVFLGGQLTPINSRGDSNESSEEA